MEKIPIKNSRLAQNSCLDKKIPKKSVPRIII